MDAWVSPELRLAVDVGGPGLKLAVDVGSPRLRLSVNLCSPGLRHGRVRGSQIAVKDESRGGPPSSLGSSNVASERVNIPLANAPHPFKGRADATSAPPLWGGVLPTGPPGLSINE